MTISARSTSSRSSSSRRISESSRSKGPADGPDAHRLADVREDRRGDRAGLLRTDLEHALDVGRVVLDLRVALARGRQPGGDLLAHGLLELAVHRLAGVLGLDLCGCGA